MTEIDPRLRRASTKLALGIPCLLILACLPAEAPPSEVSTWSSGETMRARVLENVKACEVDAICSLRLQFADTTVNGVYGTGERGGTPCPISMAVSDVAFSLEEDDLVDVSLTTCEGVGLVIVALESAGDSGIQSTGSLVGDVRGAWAASRYLLADGAEYEVRGQIFFAEREWQVLFFVIDGSGTARRASGEGGTYERTPTGVVFRHLFNLSVGEEMPGLAVAPLRMVARGPEDAPLEPTRVDVAGDTLTLHFPSGNRMFFRRTSAE